MEAFVMAWCSWWVMWFRVALEIIGRMILFFWPMLEFVALLAIIAIPLFAYVWLKEKVIPTARGGSKVIAATKKDKARQ